MRIKRFLTAFAISAAMIGPSAAADCDVSMLDQLDRFDKEVMYDFVPYSILIQAERTVIFSACYGKAQNGSAEAQYMVGFFYLSNQKVMGRAAMKWFRKSAEQGYPAAQREVGSLYYNGVGAAQNYEEAAKWLRKAAEQGDALGQEMLGDLYLEGWGVTQDKAEAARWYRKAAEQGDEVAEMSQGRMYEDCEGVEQNDQEAIRWFRKVIEQGSRDSDLAEGHIQEIQEKNKGKH